MLQILSLVKMLILIVLTWVLARPLILLLERSYLYLFNQGLSAEKGCSELFEIVLFDSDDWP